MRRQSFSQFLIGSASLERPSFFYAYGGMWLHILIGVPFLVIWLEVPLFDAVTSTAISSLSLGIIVYGVLSREYGLLVNIIAYVFSVGRAILPHLLGGTLLLVAIVITMASGYLLVSSEYRRYTAQMYDGDESRVPLWITVIIGTTLLLLFVYGLQLI